jgi:hypothetical protein
VRARLIAKFMNRKINTCYFGGAGSVDYIVCGVNEAIFENVSRQIVETSFFLFHIM